MVITQCDEHAPRRARVNELGVRIVNQFENHEFRNMQLHPKDTGGSFFEIDEQLGAGAHDEDGPWEPAGRDWQRAKCTDRGTGIVAAEVQCDQPEVVAARWAEIAEVPLIDSSIELTNATVRFVPCADGRPEGLGGIDIKVSDKAAILSAASALDAVTGEAQIQLCGMRINLVE